ncbi:hypothetical protein [Frondihabitans australicus]|uniref:DUF4232 domain-containing protein n=1 Tax=Frondihabitans australicus TaxID=386892 RepID=A0A495IJ09_9MICO|nr:hypothetical protein [Frondihabitans australicus]RKR75690.1 hypothetical protein C8E83_2840 [Frondihabitans australicus]
MSSFKHPVGSRPSRVYWRRRATAILVLVLVVVFIVIAVRSVAGSGATPVATASPTATPSTAPTVTAPTSGATSAPAPTATATAGASGSGSSSDGTCTASDITLKPIADKETYSSLEQPKISMSITNTSSSKCTIDLGSAEQVLTVTSGSETYWTSKDCQVNGTHQNVTMTAGQTLTTPSITWDRTRSSTSTCSSTRSSVPAGGASYHLSVSVGSITSSTSALMILN